MVGVTAISARGAARLAATVFGVLLVGVFVVQAAPGLVGAEASYVVLSGSMEPAISTGDTVVVDSVDPTSIEAGSVITFVRSEGGTPVTHRVIEVLDREDRLAFRTAGDANEDPDPAPVPAENVTGEVWFVIPYVGHVVLFANTPLGLAVLVGLPAAALVVSEAHAALASEESSSEAATSAPSNEAEDSSAASERTTGDTTSDTEAGASTENEAVTITTRDLQLSSVGFGSLAVYSGYIAFLDPTPVRVAVFASAAMVVLFVAWVFASGGGSSPSSEPDADEASNDVDALADGGETDRGDGDGA